MPIPENRGEVGSRTWKIFPYRHIGRADDKRSVKKAGTVAAEEEHLSNEGGSSSSIIAELDRSLGSVRRYMIKRLRNPADVDDLAQELYLALLRVDPDRVIDNPLAYVFTRAKYLIRNFWERHNRTMAEPIEELTEDIESDNLVDRQDEYLDIFQHIQDALGWLPPMHAAVLVLRHQDGYSHEEIAARLKLKEDTVHKYLTQARAKIRLYYAAQRGKP